MSLSIQGMYMYLYLQSVQERFKAVVQTKVKTGTLCRLISRISYSWFINMDKLIKPNSPLSESFQCTRLTSQ